VLVLAAVGIEFGWADARGQPPVRQEGGCAREVLGGEGEAGAVDTDVGLRGWRWGLSCLDSLYVLRIGGGAGLLRFRGGNDRIRWRRQGGRRAGDQLARGCRGVGIRSIRR